MINQNRGLLKRLGNNERSRFLPFTALVLGTGVWLAAHVTPGLWPLWLAGVSVLLAAILWRLRLPLRWACLPLVLMAALLMTQAKLNPALPNTGAYETITATVYGNPSERSSGGIAFVLCDVTLDGVPQSGRAYCTLDADSGMGVDDLFDGALLRFGGRVYIPSGKQNANDFDSRLWLLQSGIGYGITGVQGLEVLNDAQTAPWKSVSARIRKFCSGRFQALMGDEGSLAMAMLLGDRDALSTDEQLAFQKAGVAHLMAVSGLHVGLLSVALLWLLNALTLRKAYHLPVMAAFLAFYCVITGFSPASVRASVMALLIMTAYAVGRKPDPLTTLAAAAIIVLAIHPLQLFSAGFVLSFAAMASILLLYAPIRRKVESWLPTRERHGRTGKVRGFFSSQYDNLKSLLAVSLSAQIGVLLPTAAVFHRLPLYGIVFNLCAVPLAGLLVPLYAVTLLVSFLPWIGGLLGAVLGLGAKWGSWLLLQLVGFSNALPYAQVRVPSPNLWAYAGLLLGVAAVSGFVRATRWKRVLAGALVAVLACGGAYAARPSSLRYHQLAVGKADAALIIDGDKTVAIDVGLYGNEVTDRLLAEGRSLDALILTHLHLDHAQGVKALFDEEIPIGTIYLPEGFEKVDTSAESAAVWTMIRQSGVPVKTLAAGDTLCFHELTIQALWPEEGRTRAGIGANERSMATMINLGGLRILSMGDNGELYERYIAQPCDVLKVGHHGSATATAGTFLEKADPEVAFVTCGSGSQAAAESTLERLKNFGANILCTDNTGEIIIAASGNGFTISTYFSGVNDEP
ncbi:MAG: DNA internalization-related competence protein ComEC/Rec2 [Eubacteriales bacterium]|nr:DNA internalization-related competence protein ComEC/Rec2 [Eubacteriales bacterium]